MKTICFLIACLSIIEAKAQPAYWQQEVHYSIDVSLNDKDYILKGNMDLGYINHSPDTLNFIWFNIWPNGYSSKETALAKQMKEKKEFNKWFSDKDRGYIKDLDFKVNNRNAVIVPDSFNVDNIKVLLDSPLLPGDSIRIQTPFSVKLPLYFSRSGYQDQQYMITQWYPKPAVYDSRGWHQIPYLDQGEFYSEYGSFDVRITVPSAYVVAATGELQTKEELDQYKRIGQQNYLDPAKPVAYKPQVGVSQKTLQYKGADIHDFAWFADKDFIIQYDTLQLSSGKIIDAFSYYQPQGNKQWKNSISYIEDAVRYYSAWIGEYAYPTVAAVEGPKNQSSGGMEYPMITLITSPDAGAESLDAVITHEVGHNWFYGILGSNERDNPWMDEGLNSYFEFLYEAIKYKGNTIFGDDIPKDIKDLPVQEFLGRIYNALNTIPAMKPIQTSSTGFKDEDEYGTVVYLKTAIWLYLLQWEIGQDELLKGFQQYFSDWKFRHPYPQDFQRSMEQSTGKDLTDFFNLLNKEGNF